MRRNEGSAVIDYIVDDEPDGMLVGRYDGMDGVGRYEWE